MSSSIESAARPSGQARTTVILLMLCSALLLTNNVINIGMNALVGYQLAENKNWATLPLTAYVVGTALCTVPASLWMKRVGRRMGFVSGTAFGILGAAVCGLALVENSFWLLVFGTFITGAYNAVGQYYRFAAAEVVGDAWRSRAIALVLAGGIGGAILGPEGSKLVKDVFAYPFLGAYAMLGVCALAAMLLQLNLRIPRTDANANDGMPARPLRMIAAQPTFIVAVIGAVGGYATMSLLMTSTPLAMAACQHDYNATAFVIEWHVTGMYGPSFFSGWLIKRFGALRIMGTGAALMLLTVASAFTGVSIAHFWVALVLLGIGWNFLFVGGTTLLTTVYRPSERAKVQGLNDLLVFSTTGVASLMSGVLMQTIGWDNLVLATLVPMVGMLILLLWAGRSLRSPASASV
jgi:MFS family permease